jgi:hypothetical protein
MSLIYQLFLGARLGLYRTPIPMADFSSDSGVLYDGDLRDLHEPGGGGRPSMMQHPTAVLIIMGTLAIWAFYALFALAGVLIANRLRA